MTVRAEESLEHSEIRSGGRPLAVSRDKLDAARGETGEMVLGALGLRGALVSVPRLSLHRRELSAARIEHHRQQREIAA